MSKVTDGETKTILKKLAALLLVYIRCRARWLALRHAVQPRVSSASIDYHTASLTKRDPHDVHAQCCHRRALRANAHETTSHCLLDSPLASYQR